MRRLLGPLAALLLVAPLGATGQQAETLADIRQELAVLFVEMQKLKRELSTTSSVGQLAGGGSLLDRVNAIEAEVQRLTSKTEELEFRIDRVVTDGTNRVGDLEFRLCELEPACDIANLEPGSTLGGVIPQTGGGGAMPAPVPDNPQLAVGERDDFERARATYEAGDHAAAAEQLAAFLAAYPGSPLSGQAGLLRGRALEAAGQQSAAARAYLEAFSAAPEGPEAAEALFNLGRALGALGQKDEACVTLGQVAPRYPGAAVATEAAAEMARLGCS
ncbi:tetratricopeptide repeat protein [Roseovarius autotrophicus]|uniref:tetratricopeptide repeat protein n=1 Tax=Roseovarius autotrophicus TaxID=2824121 RepID=UPI0019D8138C|nr:tetratricopeptide repeat protein [Roseovarius autotrophicus]MBE0453793.1 tetratricopeptide repeat protein [Roseovarius sp.]